jgi:hypothetical protein
MNLFLVKIAGKRLKNIQTDEQEIIVHFVFFQNTLMKNSPEIDLQTVSDLWKLSG